MFYLQRFSASSERLRRVLWRRVERSARIHPDVDRAAAAAWIDAIVEKFERLGLLDDAKHAETKAGALFRRGDSRRAIAARLRADGVDRDTVDTALEALEEHAPDPDLAAAATLARRKRLGPYRSCAAARAEHRQRDMAALARKGFAPSVALAVLDAEDVAALEAQLAEDQA
ncbi:RecX family transcriptional regulator [Roseospira navarrensis]|uniref:RecX family transcriptional regulator n=1 Tax=Roseospira navarrensis TaxID=140058 RepID=UPI0031B62002